MEERQQRIIEYASTQVVKKSGAFPVIWFLIMSGMVGFAGAKLAIKIGHEKLAPFFAVLGCVLYVFYVLSLAIKGDVSKMMRREYDSAKEVIEKGVEEIEKLKEENKKLLAQNRMGADVENKQWKQIKNLESNNEKAVAEIEKAMSEFEKVQAEYKKVVADYEKAVTEIEKGCAQIKKLEAEIEKGKADNQKAKQSFEALLSEHQPIINLGLTYIDYRLNKSLSVTNSITEEERAEAKVAFDYAKGKLDDFMTNYKTN